MPVPSVISKSLCILALLVVAPCDAATVAGHAGIVVSVENDGSFDLTSRTPAWTFSGHVGAPLTGVTLRAGRDRAGSYREVEFQYATTDGASRRGAIRVYRDRPVVLFTHTFLTAGQSTESFPVIASYPRDLQHLSYTGVFGGYSFEQLGADGPWVFFDDVANTFILSPASHFMNAALSLGPRGELLSAIATDAGHIPAGFVATTALVIEPGINRAFETWGRFLTDLAGKSRPRNDADVGLKYLGYWTDNGAQYYYRFEERLGYVGTLLAVRDEFRRMGIGLGYLQLDSWFYPKGHDGKWLSGAPLGGGAYIYEASKELFPDGLAAFQAKLGLPLVTHNRWIDARSPYRTSHAISGNVSTDPKLWASWMRYLRAAGVRTYEQDWLSGPAIPARDLAAGEQFMDAMAVAAAREDITLQYCMPLPRHFLQGTRYSNLTTIRVSGDRFRKEHWPSFLFNGRLASALGEWPWTDVFMSAETSNLLLSTLSAAIVGVGDAIGQFDRANLLRAVRSDGVIVKPDEAIVPLDASYVARASDPSAPIIAAARTRHGGSITSYVFAFIPQSPPDPPPASARSRPSSTGHAGEDRGGHATFSPAALGYRGPVYAYDYFNGSGIFLRAPEDVVNLAVPDDGAYWIVVPVGPSGVGFLGDAGKFVSNGRTRIAHLHDTGTLSARVVFADGESRVSLYGFSQGRPQVRAARASVERFTYNRGTGRFQFDLVAKPRSEALVTLRTAATEVP